MRYSNTSGVGSRHPRRQQATISSTVVRCVCVTASCVVTACGLLGLGATCFILRLTDPSAAPCPFPVAVAVFAAAGLLLSLSFVLLLLLCRRRNTMRRKAQLEELPAACIEEEYKQQGDADVEAKKSAGKGETDGGVGPEEEAPPGSEDNFDMTQKSANVSLWIEQQESTESAVDCFPLENTDGGTSHEADAESQGSEMTSL